MRLLKAVHQSELCHTRASLRRALGAPATGPVPRSRHQSLPPGSGRSAYFSVSEAAAPRHISSPQPWPSRQNNFSSAKLTLFFAERKKYLPLQSHRGAVAQMVEQWTENPCVGSSILPSTTKAPLSLAERGFLCLFDLSDGCYFLLFSKAAINRWASSGSLVVMWSTPSWSMRTMSSS